MTRLRLIAIALAAVCGSVVFVATPVFASPSHSSVRAAGAALRAKVDTSAGAPVALKGAGPSLGAQDCSVVRARLSHPEQRRHGRISCFSKTTSSKSNLATPNTDGAVPGWCEDDEQWLAYRTEACVYWTGYTWYVYQEETGEILFSMGYNLSEDIVLNPASLEYVDEVDLIVTSAGGEPGAAAIVDEVCSPDCGATGNVEPVPVEAGEVIADAYTVGSEVAVNASQMESETNTLTFTFPEAPPSSATWQTTAVRCDDELDALQGQDPADEDYDAITSPGCVVPSYTPVLEDMTKLPYIRANIASIQAGGPNHYGQVGGGAPLTRANSGTQKANRGVACDGKTAPPGSPGTSCDEYPFASTNQGASQTQQPDWGIAWVPVSEQNSQGAYIKNFYTRNRILRDSGDQFWVAV